MMNRACNSPYSANQLCLINLIGESECLCLEHAHQEILSIDVLGLSRLEELDADFFRRIVLLQTASCIEQNLQLIRQISTPLFSFTNHRSGVDDVVELEHLVESLYLESAHLLLGHFHHETDSRVRVVLLKLISSSLEELSKIASLPF